ncbi:MAG: hypothetical protein OQK75_09245 [Gammaproteobacteria bacterium]|nr:hypothetical protein [Gammaproteobacteria bacterium]MCW8987837.1 hypothetical protein [Gammaproteobacteria bacterium]MCW9030773.1 hypothetical protein [Gammaproteobacteria bacterium]
MSKKFFMVLLFILGAGVVALIASNTDDVKLANVAAPETGNTKQAQLSNVTPPADAEKIYMGFYSREGNNEKMAETTGNNTYVKFYPKNRVIRLYIPYPYAKSVKPESIHMAFENAAKKTSGIAYIRDKFGAMEEPVVASLDTFRWVDGQVMYDCGKTEPCKVTFDDKSMTVLKPGMVVAHKINYTLIK